MKLLNQITTRYTLKTDTKNWNLFSFIIVGMFSKNEVVCLNSCV